MGAFVVVMVLLAGAPGAAGTDGGKAPAVAAESGVEVVISEGVLQGLLVAAAPFETDLEQEVGVLGFARTLQVHVKLTDPVVSIRKEGITVRVNYHLTDPGGTIDTRGVATPTLHLVADPAKKVFEGRLTDFGIRAAGITVPVERFVDPIKFPSVLSPEIEFGEKNLVAETQATEVILEEGKARVKAKVTFKPR